MTFRVQHRPCRTCIYKRCNRDDIPRLEAQIADPRCRGFFIAHRICHHSNDVCCRGFWNRHRDHFTLGQLAQRLGQVKFVEVDTLTKR